MSALFLGRGAQKRPLTLGKLLGEGASGKVYLVEGMKGSAAKLYHDAAEARRYEAKIDAMIAAPPDLPPGEHQNVAYPQIAWPEAKLYDAGGRFVGFLMPEIDFGRSTSLVNLLQKSSRRIEKLSEYYGYRVLVARNLASVFTELHRAGHHMIDMKPANLRFYPTVSWMAVVDTDGFSIQGRSARIAADVLSDEYIAPESWKRPAAELGEQQDLFALAVIIFQLLNNGVHPFAGSAAAGTQATDLQTRIVDGLYPYGLRPRAGITPSAASLHRMFRRGTRTLFDAAFQARGRRPAAEEWRDHLDVLMGQLAPCAARPDEHVHFGAGCGFCGHEARIAAAKSVSPARRIAATPVAKQARRHPAPPGRVAVHPRHPIPMGSVRTMPRRPLHPPMPVRRKRAPGIAGALVVLALLGGGLATQSWWRPLLPGLDGTARAEDAGIPRLDVPPPSEAGIARFAEPREYLVLPPGSSLTVALRSGPGETAPVTQQLGMHDAVVGNGTRQDADGKPWVWVTRSSDGASGYVSEDALLRRAKPGEDSASQAMAGAACGSGGRCSEAELSAGKQRVVARYEQLRSGADGYDRSFLSDGQKLWEQQRQRCANGPDPDTCRKLLDTRRLADLQGWRDAEMMSKRAEQDAVRPASLDSGT